MQTTVKPLLALLAMSVSALLFAAGGGGGGGSGGGKGEAVAKPGSPTALQEAERDIERQDWQAAKSKLDSARADDPNSADAWNWTGYVHRKQGQVTEALAAYDKALALDPKHLGAYEYRGEAWLMANQPEAAEADLAQLAKLCGECEQYQDLKAAIAQWHAAHH